MGFFEWLSLFLICLLGAMSPGVSLAVVLKNTLSSGKKSGILTSWSHAFGIGIYAFLTVVGLATILKEYPLVFKTISYLGALYLLWIGYNSLKSKGGISSKLEKTDSKSNFASIQDGFFVSFLNPKTGLFFLALFSQFINENMQIGEKIVAILTPFITDGAWYSFVVLVLLHPKIYDEIIKRAVLIDKIIGVLLILIGLKILFIS